MNFNEEDFYECENLEAITDGTIASRQRGSDLHKVLNDLNVKHEKIETLDIKRLKRKVLNDLNVRY
jgi:hypothetical protein